MGKPPFSVDLQSFSHSAFSERDHVKGYLILNKCMFLQMSVCTHTGLHMNTWIIGKDVFLFPESTAPPPKSSNQTAELAADILEDYLPPKQWTRCSWKSFPGDTMFTESCNGWAWEGS